MSPLDRPLLPDQKLAPHERLKYIFAAAPYMRGAFGPFLEQYAENPILENERVYQAICHLYLIGRKTDPSCWFAPVPAPSDLEAMETELQIIRICKRKRHGGRLWSHTRRIWKDVVGEQLPSRRSNAPIELQLLELESNALREAVASCLARIFQFWDIDEALPKRKATHTSIKKRPLARARSHKKNTI